MRAAALAVGDLHELAHDQIGDRIEPRFPQDDLALHPLDQAGVLGAVAVDERGLAVEALPGGVEEELEVERRPRQLRRRREGLDHGASDLDEGRAQAAHAAHDAVALAGERHLA